MAVPFHVNYNKKNLIPNNVIKTMLQKDDLSMMFIWCKRQEVGVRQVVGWVDQARECCHNLDKREERPVAEKIHKI